MKDLLELLKKTQDSMKSHYLAGFVATEKGRTQDASGHDGAVVAMQELEAEILKIINANQVEPIYPLSLSMFFHGGVENVN